MQYSRSPSLVDREWRTADETSSGGPVRDLHVRSDQRVGIRPVKPSIGSPRPSVLRDERDASYRPSIGRRMFRTLTRFIIAVLIGIGATLGWQSHGDAARDMLVARAPTLGWLLSVSTTTGAGAATATATAQNPMPQLEPLASNLDAVRRSVEQLAARQEQMAQNIAALRAVEEDIRQKTSSPPPLPSQPAAPIPQYKPSQPKAKSSVAQSSIAKSSVAQSSAVQSPSTIRPSPPAGPPLLPR
jgi:hypothetical protein